MSDDLRTRQGYLLLADISGYTAFLTSTELEHAHEIIHELTTLIRDRLAPPMRFVKLEGDAVFCYADEATFRDGERLIELIEACYFDFSNRLSDMTRATTCRCNACGAIGALGLKFVTHFGTYVVERDRGREDLAGSDVILVHRLLKNTISDRGGPPAYAFFTDSALRHMPPSLNLPGHGEAYESFGETHGGVHDLDPALAAMRASRRVYISGEDADLEFAFDVPVPPAAAWQYIVDPIERLRWACRQFGSDPDKAAPNAQGRSGVGATSHCSHSPKGVAYREFVDWRPFAYFTSRTVTPWAGAFMLQRPAIETVELSPAGEHGTNVVVRFRITERGRVALLALRAARPLIYRFQERGRAALLSIIEEDAAALASAT